MTTRPEHEHTGTRYDDGTCERCDWCQRCERVTEHDGETCTVCGRVWGE